MKCLIMLLLMVSLVFAKQYERCELAEELYGNHNLSLDEVGMLVCFAERTSDLYTGKNGYGAYGLFQLNGNWWCSKDDGIEDGCDMKCSDLLDDDITDDVKCVKKIISSNGLDAWGLTHQCLPRSIDIIEQCFSNSIDSGETQHVIVKDESKESEESEEGFDYNWHT